MSAARSKRRAGIRGSSACEQRDIRLGASLCAPHRGAADGAAAMSVRVMTAVWDIDLPDSEKIVLLALADCANDEGDCWPSMATLTRKCSKSERTVQSAIKRLVVAGHLTRREVPGKGCSYKLHPRKDCTPARTAPPQRLRHTPAAAAPHPRSGCGQTVKEPSNNHQGKVDDGASTPALKPDHVVDHWNAMAKRTGLPSIRSLTPQRRRKLMARIRDHPLDEWIEVFDRIERSKFLRGENQRGWTASFDFLLQPGGFVKILEGNYDRG